MRVVNVANYFDWWWTTRSSVGCTIFSEFVVRLDETLTGKAPVAAPDADTAFDLARKMITPTEAGDGFQKQYFDAIQRDPRGRNGACGIGRLFAQTLRSEAKE
jgi:hypothetical protein